jgi:hypothetical protein
MSMMGGGQGGPGGGAAEARAAALRAYNAGQFVPAATAALAAVRQGMQDATILHVLGASLVRIGRVDDGIVALRQSLSKDSKRPEAWCDLANGLRGREDYAGAHEACDRALAIAPGHPAAVRGKVALLKGEGREEEAVALLTPLMERAGADPSLSLAFASVCTGAGRRDEGIALLERVLAGGGVPLPLMRAVLSELARLLDGAGRYGEAFERACAANAAGGPIPPQDFFEGTIGTWTRARIAEVGNSGVFDDRPVFVVGMPRSGTSLMEQILAAHPEVGGIGESPAMPRIEEEIGREGWTTEKMARGARAYLQMLDARAPGKRRVVDKLPGNYTILGQIGCVLPGARVIHCVRDARDTCLSCTFQNFGKGHAYTRDLSLLGKKYAAYERLMAHWRGTITIPMLEVRYEELVEDFEGKIREVLAFAGVDWDERVLRFHEQKRHVRTASAGQVHRPLFTTSVGRWRHYEERLSPLIEAMERAREEGAG